MDISNTVEADSTQVNADDLIASPRTVTITGVNKGTADQPVNIELAEFHGRVYRPCKTMRRLLIAAWGKDASAYIGRRLTLYNDSSVKWGGQAVGGIRISHMSHIERPIEIALTVTRGRRAAFIVEPLAEPPSAISEFRGRISSAASMQELETVAKDLKAMDLGEHHSQLLAAWTTRKTELSGGPS